MKVSLGLLKAKEFFFIIAKAEVHRQQSVDFGENPAKKASAECSITNMHFTHQAMDSRMCRTSNVYFIRGNIHTYTTHQCWHLWFANSKTGSLREDIRFALHRPEPLLGAT